jgi:hypothetical protein
VRVEIEISEKTAACVWSNAWGRETTGDLRAIAERLLESEAWLFARRFPKSVDDAVREFRMAFPDAVPVLVHHGVGEGDSSIGEEEPYFAEMRTPAASFS